MRPTAHGDNRAPLAVVILAAGEGKRMRSTLPKVLHEVAGRPMLEHLLRAVAPLAPERTVVIVGHQAERVMERFAGRDVTFVQQDFSSGYGTGHALRESAKGLAGFEGPVLVLNGDGPLLRTETLKALVRELGDQPGMAFITCVFSDPVGLGRVVRGADGEFNAIVEEGDASAEQRAIREVNPGVYLFDASVFARAAQLRNDNAAAEYYITDLPGLYLTAGERVRTVLAEDETELLGVNDKRQLALAERVLRERIRRRWLEAGVTMLHPESTFIDDEVTIGAEVVLEQGVVLRGRAQVGAGTRVGAYSVVDSASLAPGSCTPPHTVLAGGNC